jgi:hypothetical protein
MPGALCAREHESFHYVSSAEVAVEVERPTATVSLRAPLAFRIYNFCFFIAAVKFNLLISGLSLRQSYASM